MLKQQLQVPAAAIVTVTVEPSFINISFAITPASFRWWNCYSLLLFFNGARETNRMVLFFYILMQMRRGGEKYESEKRYVLCMSHLRSCFSHKQLIIITDSDPS